MEPITIVWLAILGIAISFIQERFGKFEELPAKYKQLINSIITLIVPVLVATVAGWWRPEFGDSAGFFTALLQFTAPVVIWLVTWLSSQLGHFLDKGLAKLTS